MFRQTILALALSILSALLHALGLLGLLYWQTRLWPWLEADFRPRRNLPVFLSLFVAIWGLHLAEISLWAGFYYWGVGLPSLETSLYFSATSYATVGYGDIILPRPWRLAGALESLTGVLLLGWSAAFFFTVVHRFFEVRIHRWQQDGD
ncbi:MAG: potassium channel family protein [Acidobacteriaceae bacterium]